MDSEDRVLWSIIAMALLLAACVVVFSVLGVLNNGRVQAECLSRGYPSYAVTYTLKPYCIRRVDNTDMVVPLEDLRR